MQAHLEIIKDPLLTEEVVKTIRKDRKNAEFVFSSVMGEIEKSLCAVQKTTATTVDRVQDIHDISNRVIGHLCCQHKSSLGEFDQNLIVFSEELTPSEAANANPEYIRGFVSLEGAKLVIPRLYLWLKIFLMLPILLQSYGILLTSLVGH